LQHLTRGRVIKSLYPEASIRRRIYKTSLAPQSAIRLIDIAETVKQELIGGLNYAALDTDEKINFIVRVITLLLQVPTFNFPEQLSNANNAPNWAKLLRWWLAKDTVTPQPNADKTSVWYQFIANNIIYKANWGIGSVLSLLFDTTEDGIPVRPLEIDDWPRSGLPWIAFWLKELLSWGTLDPVVAFLMAKGGSIDRDGAALETRGYYAAFSEEDWEDPNEILNPRKIREWLSNNRNVVLEDDETVPGAINIAVDLYKPENEYKDTKFTVTPLLNNERIKWVESAGYSLGESQKPNNWDLYSNKYLFELDVNRQRIIGRPYL